MTEVVIWTVIFFGGDLLAIVLLGVLAVRKDKEKARTGEI